MDLMILLVYTICHKLNMMNVQKRDIPVKQWNIRDVLATRGTSEQYDNYVIAKCRIIYSNHHVAARTMSNISCEHDLCLYYLIIIVSYLMFYKHVETVCPVMIIRICTTKTSTPCLLVRISKYVINETK